MQMDQSMEVGSPRTTPAASVALLTAGGTLLALAGMHLLSPEFDPSWRMVSEYANGRYGGLLSIMFVLWGASSWALAVALWPKLTSGAGRAGVMLLVAAGTGEAVASVFDINHPLHDVAGFLGVGCLPVAAMLISTRRNRSNHSANRRRNLLLAANLTWVSVLVLVAAFILMVVTFIQAGGDPSVASKTKVMALPHGVVGLVGWANRLLVVAYCAWVAMAAWQLLKTQREPESHSPKPPRG